MTVLRIALRAALAFSLTAMAYDLIVQACRLISICHCGYALKDAGHVLAIFNEGATP